MAFDIKYCKCGRAEIGCEYHDSNLFPKIGLELMMGKLSETRALQVGDKVRWHDPNQVKDTGIVDAIALGAHCQICPLRGNPIVPPKPNLKKLQLVVVGEGPGRVEENLGSPFLGRSGKLLDVQLRANGIKRSSCHVTNTALCRGDSDKDNEKAAECCTPRLLRELSNLDPKVPILALGKAATVAILGVKSLMAARGFVWTSKAIDPKKVKEAYRKAAKLADKAEGPTATLKADIVGERAKIGGRTVLPTLHPAFVLRADVYNPIFRIDLERVGRVVRGELVLENEGQHQVGGPELLEGMGPEVTCDLETTIGTTSKGMRVNPMSCNILCCGISDGKRDVVLYPWKDSWGPRLAKFLGSREKIVFHNGFAFDTIVLRNHEVVW